MLWRKRCKALVSLSGYPIGAPPHPPITEEVSCMGKDALAVCDQLRTVGKVGLSNWIEEIDQEPLDSIRKALQQVLYL